MKLRTVLLAGLLAASEATAQLECRTDPQSADLEFAVGARGDSLEFRGRNPARQLGKACVLTLECSVRQPPLRVDYFMMPQRAGDPPAVWNIRRVRLAFADGSEQDCRVTASSEARPPLAAPPPFIRNTGKR